MNKSDIIEQIRQEAFNDEISKIAEIGDIVRSRKERMAQSFSTPKYRVQPSQAARMIAEDIKAIASGAKKAVTGTMSSAKKTIQQRQERAGQVFGRAGQYKIAPSKPVKPAVTQIASSK